MHLREILLEHGGAISTGEEKPERPGPVSEQEDGSSAEIVTLKDTRRKGRPAEEVKLEQGETPK